MSIFTSIVYKAVVLGVLLYAVETWPIKQRELHSLEVFHHRCLRTILGISRAQQIAQHISNEEVRGRMGMPVPLGDIISNCRLCWLGHLGRMCDSCLPKQFLFGWLPQCHPSHGVKLTNKPTEHMHMYIILLLTTQYMYIFTYNACIEHRLLVKTKISIG